MLNASERFVIPKRAVLNSKMNSQIARFRRVSRGIRPDYRMSRIAATNLAIGTKGRRGTSVSCTRCPGVDNGRPVSLAIHQW